MLRYLTILFILGFSISSYGDTSKKHYVCFNVFTSSGLQLRESPDTKSKIITKIPYGSQVKVKNILSDKKMTIDNIDGHWAMIEYNGKTGYSFDGYLSIFPAPESGDTSRSIPRNKLVNYYWKYCRYYSVCLGGDGGGGKAELNMLLNHHGYWSTEDIQLSLYSDLISLKDGFLIMKALFNLPEKVLFPEKEYKGNNAYPIHYKGLPQDNIWKSVYKKDGSMLKSGSYLYFIKRDNEMGDVLILRIEKTDFGIKLIKEGGDGAGS